MRKKWEVVPMFGPEDLPLFSGTAPRVVLDVFEPLLLPLVSQDLLPLVQSELEAAPVQEETGTPDK